MAMEMVKEKWLAKMTMLEMAWVKEMDLLQLGLKLMSSLPGNCFGRRE
jgi:hypothetical protein